MNNNITTIKSQARKLNQNEKINYNNAVSRKLEKQGSNYAVVTSTIRYGKNYCKKISKDEYIYIPTGEIKQYKGTTAETKQAKNLYQTFARLKGLIRHNFDSCSKNQLFVTLTYKKNMTDTKRLYKDFNAFCKRLKYAYQEHKLEYIAVAEPQGRGAWHLHIMLKSTNKSNLYIDNKDLARIWGYGYTDTQRLVSDDVGAYYVSYFTDILSETGNKKAKIKGARLAYYPQNFKFYRCSRGIKKPQVQEISREQEKELLKDYKVTAVKIYDIIDTDSTAEEPKIINTIIKTYYKRRKNNKHNNYLCI